MLKRRRCWKVQCEIGMWSRKSWGWIWRERDSTTLILDLMLFSVMRNLPLCFVHQLTDAVSSSIRHHFCHHQHHYHSHHHYRIELNCHSLRRMVFQRASLPRHQGLSMRRLTGDLIMHPAVHVVVGSWLPWTMKTENCRSEFLNGALFSFNARSCGSNPHQHQEKIAMGTNMERTTTWSSLMIFSLSVTYSGNITVLYDRRSNLDFMTSLIYSRHRSCEDKGEDKGVETSQLPVSDATTKLHLHSNYADIELNLDNCPIPRRIWPCCFVLFASAFREGTKGLLRWFMIRSRHLEMHLAIDYSRRRSDWRD